MPVAPAAQRSRLPFPARLTQCVIGLIVFALGIAVTFRAELGRAPWDVLHEGISDRVGLDVGTVIIVVGVVILALWIPLRERPGLGTALNAVLVGVVFDLVEAHLPSPEAMAPRIALLAAGIVLVGVGTAIYIRAGLGPGPRDGLMTGLARITPMSIRVARTVVEASALVAGIALGGEFGVGTLAFAITVGPIVQLALKAVDRLLGVPPTAAPDAEAVDGTFVDPRPSTDAEAY